jgi:hypothetical protein
VPMKRSTIAFARGARIGVRMIRMSAPVKTASKAELSPGRARSSWGGIETRSSQDRPHG